MITGTIFDVDGTLLDSMPIWDHAGEDYLKLLGIQAENGLGEKLFTMTMPQGAEYLKTRYHLKENVDEIIAGVNEVIRRFYYEEVPLKPGVRQFLKGLKRNKVRMTAATSSDRHIIEAAFERLKIDQYFEKIFTCSEIGAGKIEPTIFLAARDFMGTKKCATWVFEDALYSLLTAGRAGFRTVGVHDPSSSGQQEQIQKNADIYLTQWNHFESFWEKASLFESE